MGCRHESLPAAAVCGGHSGAPLLLGLRTVHETATSRTVVRRGRKCEHHARTESCRVSEDAP